MSTITFSEVQQRWFEAFDLAFGGEEYALNRLRDMYAEGDIEIDELERRVERVLYAAA